MNYLEELQRDGFNVAITVTEAGSMFIYYLQDKKESNTVRTEYVSFFCTEQEYSLSVLLKDELLIHYE